MTPGARIDPADFLHLIPGPAGERSTLVFEHGTLTVKLYAPRGVDLQTPHTRDEAYIVIGGRGTFVRGEERKPFEPNDFLFAPAGLPHRFEDFSDDLLVWVLSTVPKGASRRAELLAELVAGVFHRLANLAAGLAEAGLDLAAGALISTLLFQNRIVHRPARPFLHGTARLIDFPFHFVAIHTHE